MGSRADAVPEHLQDPRGRELGGELCGVVAGAQAGEGGVQVTVLVAQRPGQHAGQQLALPLQLALGGWRHDEMGPIKHGGPVVMDKDGGHWPMARKRLCPGRKT